jgi:hypothetical protein
MKMRYILAGAVALIVWGHAAGQPFPDQWPGWTGYPYRAPPPKHGPSTPKPAYPSSQPRSTYRYPLPVTAWIQERENLPPARGRPLRDILQRIEAYGFGPVMEIEYEDGHWQVGALRKGQYAEFAIDAYSGRLLQPRSRDLQPVSEIVRAIEDNGFRPIVELEFDGDSWEVEAYRDGKPIELEVDAFTGEIHLPDSSE